jgi:hypothetical protein
MLKCLSVECYIQASSMRMHERHIIGGCSVNLLLFANLHELRMKRTSICAVTHQSMALFLQRVVRSAAVSNKLYLGGLLLPHSAQEDQNCDIHIHTQTRQNQFCMLFLTLVVGFLSSALS